MVDFFLLLMLAGAGDELQGIKKGIMEMADGLLITKADGENVNKAMLAKTDFQHALHLFPLAESGWKPQVLTCSAVTKQGLPETWQSIEKYLTHTRNNQYFYRNRTEQNLAWFHESLIYRLRFALEHSPRAAEHIKEMEARIRANQILPSRAANEIIHAFLK